MNCPSCGTKGMVLIPEADLYRCPNCLWTITKADATPKRKRRRAAKKT